MKYGKHLGLILILFFYCAISFSQTFMVLEKMGTKKRYVYYVGETIDYQLAGVKSYERGLITNILDSAFITSIDTIAFSSIKSLNIKSKRKDGILNKAAPVLIAAGIVLLAIDFINSGIGQNGGYEWDARIGATSLALAGTGALIILAQKNKKSLDGWWRLRKASIY